jgi:CheY-like chemotaxis protein
METPMEEARLKIVVIDDDPAVLALLEVRLRSRYYVVSTSDAHNAVSLVRAELPDAVVCDIDMPGVSGAEISALLLKEPFTAHIPLVYLTNLATADEMADLGEEISGRPCVAKNAPIQKLRDMLDRLCPRDSGVLRITADGVEAAPSHA